MRADRRDLAVAQTTHAYQPRIVTGNVDGEAKLPVQSRASHSRAAIARFDHRREWRFGIFIGVQAHLGRDVTAYAHQLSTPEEALMLKSMRFWEIQTLKALLVLVIIDMELTGNHYAAIPIAGAERS